MAPFFGAVQTQIDQNLMVMQILEEVAAKHGLACLMQEKPFQGINGSGKHNNWSIATTEGTSVESNKYVGKSQSCMVRAGTQLLVPKSINADSGNEAIFPVVMAGNTRCIAKC